MNQSESDRLRALVTWLDAGVPGHWAKRYGIAVLATGLTLAIAITLSRVAWRSRRDMAGADQRSLPACSP
jgi:hypothetical protein